MSDVKRDLAADLALCEVATPGPWVVAPEGLWEGDPLVRPRAVVRPRPDLAEKYPPGKYGAACREDRIVTTWLMRREDVAFIAAAREALPHAIRRAMAAEARVEVVQENLRKLMELVVQQETELQDLRERYAAACDRIAAQSELLSRRAEGER